MRRKQRFIFVLFLLVPLLAYVVFRLSLIPYGIYYSFTDMAYVGRRAWDWGFVGLQNDQRLLTDTSFLESCKNSFIYAVACGLIGQFWLGFFLGMIIWDGKLKGGTRGWVTTLLTAVAIISWIAPETVAGFEWCAMLDKYEGMLNKFLGVFGVGPIEWLRMRGGWLGIPTALYALIIANIWKGCSFSMVMFSTAMEGIPREIYDAVKIDGANKMQELIYITFPLLRHMLPFILLILFTGSFSHFGFLWIITGQAWREVNVGIYSYHTAFRRYEIGYGAAIAVTLGVIYLVFGVLQRRLRREPEIVVEK
jgi:ABC-type sugar transport system permease subunit